LRHLQPLATPTHNFAGFEKNYAKGAHFGKKGKPLGFCTFKTVYHINLKLPNYHLRYKINQFEMSDIPEVAIGTVNIRLSRKLRL